MSSDAPVARGEAVFGGGAAAAIPAVNPWVVAISVMAAVFMEVLDTTVVNVSLPHIAGSMSSTTDEATWALTSYLVANAIVLPMTGWLATTFGRKRLLLGSVIGFTASSFLCGFAPNLPFLIFFRVIQGLTGGGLQPLSQAIMLEVFPPRERGKAMAFWGLGIVVAPMLGPVMGGWLTDNFSWRWVFYINIPVGLLAVIMISLFVFDPPYLRRRAGSTVDWFGIGLLVVGIGSLQIMLDKGQQEDWFASRFITVLAVLAFGGIAALIVRELMAEHPIVDLRVFKNRTYATGVFLITVLGFVLYGSTVLLPLLMQTLLGYSAFDAGVTTLPRGMASFIMMPIIGILMGKIEARKLLATGVIVTGLSMFMLSHVSLDVGYWEFFWALIVQGGAMGLLFIPLTTITNDPIPKERMGNATSVFNLLRNIGGSIGIATVTTLLSRYNQVHVNELGAHVTRYSATAMQQLEGIKRALIAAGSDPVTAERQATAALFGKVQQQAAIMSYDNVFLIMAVLFWSMLPLILFMRKPKGGDHPTAAH